MSATLPTLGDPVMTTIRLEPVRITTLATNKNQKTIYHYLKHRLPYLTLPPESSRHHFEIIRGKGYQLRQPGKYLLANWTNPNGEDYYLYTSVKINLKRKRV